MNADRCRLHVQTIVRNGGLAYPRQIWRNHRKFLAQHRQYRGPHARRLRIPMEQDQRCAMAARRVVKLYALNLRYARDELLVRGSRARHSRKRKRNQKQAKQTTKPRKAKAISHCVLLCATLRPERPMFPRQRYFAAAPAADRAALLSNRGCCAKPRLSPDRLPKPKSSGAGRCQHWGRLA